jgi:hypothetical protein
MLSDERIRVPTPPQDELSESASRFYNISAMNWLSEGEVINNQPMVGATRSLFRAERQYFSIEIIWARRRRNLSRPRALGHSSTSQIFSSQVNGECIALD